MALRCASVGACENTGVKPVNMTVAIDAHSVAARLNVLIILRYPCRLQCGSGFCAAAAASIEVKSSKKGRQKNFRKQYHFLFRVPLQVDCLPISWGSRSRVLLNKKLFPEQNELGYGNEADAIASIQQIGCRGEANSREHLPSVLRHGGFRRADWL
jgi:hypothetical protein